MTVPTISLDPIPFVYSLPDGRRAIAVDDEIALLVPARVSPMEALGGFLQALVELAASEAPSERPGGLRGNRESMPASLAAS